MRYDTFVALPAREGLRPGMSAEVEISVAEHKDVLLIPVAAVVETDSGVFCWVQTSEGVSRRQIRLGDTNEVFSIVTDGLNEGDEVLLNHAAYEQPTAEDFKAGESASDEEAVNPDQGNTP